VVIASSSSPHRKLSNGISFAKFHNRLSPFPFSIGFLLEKIELKRNKSQQGRKEEGSALWDPTAVKGVKERDGVSRVDPVYVI
jgi:hypothetical protein